MESKKKFITTLFIILTAVLSIQGMSLQNEKFPTLKEDPKKTQITPSELPKAVKSAIMKSDYAQWNIVKAYIITYSDASEKIEYEVHFTNEEGKKSKQIEVYDKEGKVIED